MVKSLRERCGGGGHSNTGNRMTESHKELCVLHWNLLCANAGMVVEMRR